MAAPIILSGITLTKLRRLAERATPGKRIAEYLSDGGHRVIATGRLGGERIVCDGVGRNDAEFIAAASPEMVLAMADEIVRLRCELVARIAS